MGTNALVFFVALGVIGLAWASAGVADLWLYLEGRPTISEWLRAHPAWFIVPALVTLLFLAALSIHLFGRG